MEDTTKRTVWESERAELENKKLAPEHKERSKSRTVPHMKEETSWMKSEDQTEREREHILYMFVCS